MSDVDKFGRLIQINRMSSTSGKHRTMLTCTIRKKVSLGFGIQKGTTMSYFTHPIAMSAPFTRSVAIAALIFYRIDRNVHQHNLDQLREAAATAATGEEEILEGFDPSGITKLVSSGS